MADTQYKITYEEKNTDFDSKSYGFLVQRTKTFETFTAAVHFSRVISNTNINIIGTPMIEEI